MLDIILMLVATFLTAVLSLSGGVLFLSNSRPARRIQKFGPLIAAAVLIYTVFGDIIPEILSENSLDPLHMIALILAGFAICALFGWILDHSGQHHHTAHAQTNKHKQRLTNKSEAISMLVIDSIHNVADGLVLGASFLASPATGLTTCLATVAHEIPQEIGDFAIMQKSKIPRARILKLQFFSGLAIVPAALIAYIFGDIFENYLPTVLALIAGFLLSIAMSEILTILDFVRARIPKQLKLKK